MYVIKAGVLYEIVEGAQKEFRSPFAEEYYEEERRTWNNESWKYKQGEDDPQQDLIPRTMIWGGRGKVKPPARVTFSAVVTAHDRLYYVLQMSTSCGLFYYDLETRVETRLFHRTEFQPHGLFIGDDNTILTTVTNGDGSVHLAEYDAAGKRERVITSGDCRDENPVRRGSNVYYQSSGLARNAQGAIVAAGNTTINCLNVETGDIETVLSAEKYDYLLPRLAGDDVLYCIQAPHQTGTVYPFQNLLLDIVLFPWRLCVAVFGFLNVFSMLFAKKPLTTAGGPNAKPVDMSSRVLHNRIVNVQKSTNKESKCTAVSKEWKLVRFEGGKVTEIASNVLWFDLDGSDQPVYTDGFSLYDSHGKQQYEADEMVSCIAAQAIRSAAG